MTIKTTRLATIVLLLATLLVPVTALAIQPQERSPEAPYVSPDRDRCEIELRKDLAWYATLKLQLRDDVHADESATFTRNNRHVIIAYIAIWVLTVGFVVMMFLRQGRLQAEVARLSSELARATKDGAA